MTDEEHITSENALQMIGRLQIRPSLKNLEPNLFPDGLKIKEIVEIFGDHSTGKTLLIKELTRKCILPKNYDNIALNGLEAGVVLLNTDLHFNFNTFAPCMINYLEKMLKNKVPNKDEVVEIITKCSLERLKIVNIYNSETMYFTFHLLKNLLFSNEGISLIIIDSISANYWQDRISNGIKKMDGYIQHVLSCLHKCIEPFKVTVIFTRPLYFQTKPGALTDISPVYNLLKINTSIHLMRSKYEEGYALNANVRTSDKCYVKFFSVGPEGVQWS